MFLSLYITFTAFFENIVFNLKYDETKVSLQINSDHVLQFKNSKTNHEQKFTTININLSNVNINFSNMSTIKSLDEQINIFNMGTLTDYDMLKELNKLIKDSVSVFHENNLTYWIGSGTLLGAIRDKGSVPWDDDADLGLMDYDMDKFIGLQEQFQEKNIEFVQIHGFYKLYRKNGTVIKMKYKFKYPFVDVFIYKLEGEFIYTKNLKKNKLFKSGLFKFDFFKYHELFPVRLYQYEDFECYGPNNPFRYLNKRYKNWKNIGKVNRHIRKKVAYTMQNFPIHYYNPNISKPYLWLVKHSTSSENEIVIKNYLNSSFEVTRLDKYNLLRLMPEIESINVSKRLEYQLISIMFLYKYGGIFVDSSSVDLQKKLNFLFYAISKLAKYEFIGIGCDSNNDCTKPSSYIMVSRPRRILMENVLRRLIIASNQDSGSNKSNQLNLVELILWEEIFYLKKKYNYDYFHYYLTKYKAT